MQIYATVNLAVDDQWTLTSQEAASAVLAALGGDPAKDACTMQVTTPAEVVGTVPAPPGVAIGGGGEELP